MRKSFWIVPFSSFLVLACATRPLPQGPVTSTELPPPHQAVQSSSEGHVDLANSSHGDPAARIPTAQQTSKKAAHTEVTGTDPNKALGWLKNGNVRYIKGRLRADGQKPTDIQRLAKGQAPHSIVLSCSDSRVPPEIVFDQKLGEIFVVRNAGEIPDPASVASIEYAIEHLGSRLLVVMGHTSCGAVKAALSTLDGGDAGSPALNALVHDIHPRLASYKGRKPAADVEEESWANARGIVKELMKRSAIIAEKVSSGQLQIKAALYHLDNGKVAFDP